MLEGRCFSAGKTVRAGNQRSVEVEGCLYGSEGHTRQSGRNRKCMKGPHGAKSRKSLLGQVVKAVIAT